MLGKLISVGGGRVIRVCCVEGGRAVCPLTTLSFYIGTWQQSSSRRGRVLSVDLSYHTVLLRMAVLATSTRGFLFLVPLRDATLVWWTAVGGQGRVDSSLRWGSGPQDTQKQKQLGKTPRVLVFLCPKRWQKLAFESSVPISKHAKHRENDKSTVLPFTGRQSSACANKVCHNKQPWHVGSFFEYWPKMRPLQVVSLLNSFPMLTTMERTVFETDLSRSTVAEVFYILRMELSPT